jgi:hypothetical protein
MGRDAQRIGAQVEEPADALDDVDQRRVVGGVHAEHELRACGVRPRFDCGRVLTDAHGAAVDPVLDPLDARGGAAGEEAEHRGPRQRRPVGQADDELAGRRRVAAPPPQLGRRGAEGRADRVVELPQAAEPGSERELGHGQIRLVQEPPREVHAPRARHLCRRGAQVLHEEAPELPLAQPETCRERRRVVALERPRFDQPQRPRHHRRRPIPGRRAGSGFRPAAQARAEARLLGGGRAGEEDDVGGLGERRGADRAAVHPRRPNAGEEAAVESAIPRLERAVAAGGVELHGRRHSRTCRPCLAESGHGRRGPAPAVRCPLDTGRRVALLP